ncbi:hypothetical protein MNBD_GAMMA25-335 [hydrothermal vent metagenome]|uniref:DUF3581 domain-containing protein n=1 Tax=hydrothermal vent metagenome TaxID=652676 RepID=A0A3B1AJZ9_9ZZZZ
MMQLDNFYSTENNKIYFSREQASDFAKRLAGDFNPLHDPDSKRFCVPGDLIFALILARYGLCQQMEFTFSGMVGEGMQLDFVESSPGTLSIIDERGKECLGVKCEGEKTTNQTLTADLSQRYVEFSGQTFPHILVPLMKEQRVMINPERPMIIYQSMIINLERLDFSAPELELSSSQLKVNGKRGQAQLNFQLKSAGEIVGRGQKNMILSSLREYDQEKIDRLSLAYNQKKQNYTK